MIAFPLNFGPVMKKYREKKGWSPDDLAAKTTIHRTSLLRYERGAACPTWAAVLILQHVLKIPWKELIQKMPATLDSL